MKWKWENKRTYRRASSEKEFQDLMNQPRTRADQAGWTKRVDALHVYDEDDEIDPAPELGDFGPRATLILYAIAVFILMTLVVWGTVFLVYLALGARP